MISEKVVPPVREKEREKFYRSILYQDEFIKVSYFYLALRKKTCGELKERKKREGMRREINNALKQKKN